MIDPESEVFTTVATAMRATVNGLVCLPEAPNDIASYPCLILQQMDLSEVEDGRDLENNMNLARSMFQADVHSNSVGGSKSQCKNILALLTNEMGKIGYTLISTIPETPPAREGTTRYTARYSMITA